MIRVSVCLDILGGYILKTLIAVATATYKEWAAYRSHMLISIFVGPIFFLVQYFIWGAVYRNNFV